MKKIPDSIRKMPKVELHQHVDGSIPPAVTWRIMKRYDLNPVETLPEMKKLLQLQPGEEGSLLAYLDKFHFPMWITQFYENIQQVSEAVVTAAAKDGVHTIELRYAPVIHVYAGLTIRQAIRSVLAGLNRAKEKYPKLKAGLVVIAMRQHGPHVAKIIAKAAISEAEYLHNRSGVVGFDIAGPEDGFPPSRHLDAFQLIHRENFHITIHAGEAFGAPSIHQALHYCRAHRIGHGTHLNEDVDLMNWVNDHRIPLVSFTGSTRMGMHVGEVVGKRPVAVLGSDDEAQARRIKLIGDDPKATILDAYRRLGAEPFKAALYPVEAARDAA